ncbi:hypothetical protein TEA_025374 [Camellia sinensis var. sinensis]|uniref:Uncharacterized protein n=1 Tax=Camellia sinensis var. sinensis TaxID=542762 RepID=A0A4S4F0F7_CAMSN|nr:hypothetical protein TEA_025374 [Camellia sinensis var. sinensis]
MKALGNLVAYCVKEKKPCVWWVEKYFMDCLCNLNDELSFGFGMLYTASTVVLVLQTIYYDHFYSWWKCRQIRHSQQRVEEEKEPSKSPKPADESGIPIPGGPIAQSHRKFYYTSARSLAGSSTPPTWSYLRAARSGPSAMGYTDDHSSDDDVSFLSSSNISVTQPKPIPRPAGWGAFLATSVSLPQGSKALKQVYMGLSGRRLLQEESMENNVYGQWLGWMMAAIYMGGRIPQIWLNGLNPLMFFFALVANAAYVASILVRTSEWDKIKANMPWLLDAVVCVLLDLFYIYYRYMRKRSTSGRKDHGDYMEANKALLISSARISFAKICVEIGLDSLPNDFLIKCEDQSVEIGVEYLWTPSKCSKCDQLAIAKETGRRLGMGTNMYPSSALLGQHKDESIAALPVDELIEKADGFAGVFPEHKYEIVKRLQARKHICGMTSDGVNDAPALKKADIGIVVADATDAARNASDIVLTEPGLSVIISAVLTSRAIFQRMKNYTVNRAGSRPRQGGSHLRVLYIFKCFPFTYFPFISALTAWFYVTHPHMEVRFPTLMVLIIAILNDGTIMAISKDRVKPSPQPDSWKLSEIFATGIILGSYLAMMTAIFFWAAYDTDIFPKPISCLPRQIMLIDIILSWLEKKLPRNLSSLVDLRYIEFYDAMSMRMAIALSGHLLFGQPLMVKPSKAEKNLVQTNASGGGSVVGSYIAVDRKLYVGNLHFSITVFQLRQESSYKSMIFIIDAVLRCNGLSITGAATKAVKLHLLSSWCNGADSDPIHPSKSVDCKLAHLSDEVFDSHILIAPAFVQKLFAEASTDSARCPYLANLEIERRKFLFGKGDDDKLIEALMQYFFSYIEFFDAMPVPMAIALSSQPLLG